MERCEFPRCKYYPNITYIGHSICDEHWKQICESNKKSEQKLLKKIGLIRNNNGSVVSITEKEK